MTLKQLLYFKKLSELLNYRQTAKELFISQPSLSYTIKELENELGANLFEKNDGSNRIRLSEAGIIFLDYITKALQNIDDGSAAVRQYMFKEESTLRFGYIHTFPLKTIQSLFHDFQTAYPNVEENGDKIANYDLHREIFSSNASILSELETNKLNFGFCLSLNKNVDGFPFYYQKLYVVVSKNHPLGKRNTITFDELRREPCIRVGHAMEINTRLDKIYHEYNTDPVVSFQADHINAALAYVMDYNCYTIAPKMSTTDFSELTTLTIEGHPLSRPIYFAWKKGKKFTPFEQIFYDYARSRMAEEL